MWEKFRSKFKIVPSYDPLHWSIPLGIKLEIPRATKYNFDRWAGQIRVACFGLALHRLNDTRVAKPSTKVDIQLP